MCGNLAHVSCDSSCVLHIVLYDVLQLSIMMFSVLFCFFQDLKPKILKVWSGGIYCFWSEVSRTHKLHLICNTQ